MLHLSLQAFVEDLDQEDDDASVQFTIGGDGGRGMGGGGRGGDEEEETDSIADDDNIDAWFICTHTLSLW